MKEIWILYVHTYHVCVFRRQILNNNLELYNWSSLSKDDMKNACPKLGARMSKEGDRQKQSSPVEESEKERAVRGQPWEEGIQRRMEWYPQPGD